MKKSIKAVDIFLKKHPNLSVNYYSFMPSGRMDVSFYDRNRDHDFTKRFWFLKDEHKYIARKN